MKIVVNVSLDRVKNVQKKKKKIELACVNLISE